MIKCKNVETYIHRKGQKNQVVWCWKKVSFQRMCSCMFIQYQHDRQLDNHKCLLYYRSGLTRIVVRAFKSFWIPMSTHGMVY